ncbi:hypothetical protein [Streptomyces sp. UNOC14_S4]|uniref:hypothetical protein n=1 Tax=Streptomyces sp. UNOC14_S4 TaxID=2872340 RepID=UPI001E51E279|nr:hypothetical protein [Streptomyces sp. UNOC14_S4]MCC3768349.1 hypothetical protein [Streptomyces sp. UNOC14_S4]
MSVAESGDVVTGVLVLTLSSLLAVAALMWWLLPDPRRAFTPPPVGLPGYRFRCRCHDRPITVVVLDSREHGRRLAAHARRRRRKHARPSSLPHPGARPRRC